MSSPRSTTATRSSRLLLAGLLTALTLAVWPASGAAAATHPITIKNYAYGSGSMTISQGDTVTWTNQDSAPHDVIVTSGPVTFRSPMMAKGKSWSYTFTKAGTYSYTCSVHPDMHATITAKAKAAPAPPAATAPAAAAPAPRSAGPASAAPATPTPAPAVTPSASAPGTSYVATTAEQASPSLDPLLLLLGLSAAIVVFCLLLLVSRPLGTTTNGDSHGN